MVSNLKLVLGVVIAASPFAPAAYSQTAEPDVIDVRKSLGPLLEAAYEDPGLLQRGALKKDFVKAFKLPFGPDELWTMELVTEPKENHQRVLYVRPMPDACVYLFMVDLVDNKIGYFYHTSLDGKLIHAIRGNRDFSYDIPIDKAKKDFEAELAFWRDWLAAKKPRNPN